MTFEHCYQQIRNPDTETPTFVPQDGTSCFEFRALFKRNDLEETGCTNTWGEPEIDPLSSDKGIVSPLVLNGRGGCGSIVMAGENHRFSGQDIKLFPNRCFEHIP
jgi:hypothetical protein